jgi:hypothetical protein
MLFVAAVLGGGFLWQRRCPNDEFRHHQGRQRRLQRVLLWRRFAELPTRLTLTTSRPSAAKDLDVTKQVKTVVAFAYNKEIPWWSASPARKYAGRP